MQRTVLWDHTFEGILAYMQDARPDPLSKQIFHGQNKGDDLLKVESELEIWDMFIGAFQALKTDPRSDQCGDLPAALKIISLRSTHLGRTLNMQPLDFAAPEQQPPKSIDDRYAFLQIDRLMDYALQDFEDSQTGMIRGVNHMRNQGPNSSADRQTLQNIFTRAQAPQSKNPTIGTDVSREMAFKLKALVSAYKRIYNDVSIQLEKSSPYAAQRRRKQLQSLVSRKPDADKKSSGGIILP